MTRTDIGTGGYEVEVRYTEHHVAHVRAGDWGSLGFGQGWACARDHLATLCDQVTKVTSQRARYFGPGPEGAHIASDLGYQMLDVAGRARAMLAAQTPELHDLIEGYAAGVSFAVSELGVEWELPEWCRGAPWVRRISTLDLCAHLVDVTLMASGRNLAELIGRAEAPGPDGPLPPSPVTSLGVGYASNGWAFGRDATGSGRGAVMANPHFPWFGEARFWECHLTIPGTLDVYGACLLGAPGVHIGFNAGVAWTHTFSAGHRFGLYRLDLSSDDPTQYRFGDEYRSMTPISTSCEVLTDDGSIEPVERTLWRTHHGPMVNLPLLGWGTETGFTYRDANIDNTAFLQQFIGMDRATDLASFQEVFAEAKGMPWANTIAADSEGTTWYIDASATPNLSGEAQRRFRRRTEEDFVAGLLAQNRVALLDGSDPGDTWVDEPGARSLGLVPHNRLPQLTRTDFVANANDSHWLANPSAALVGYSVLHGPEGVAQSLRTRANLLACQRLAATGSVDLEAIADELFSNRSLSADLLVDGVVERCRRAGSVTVEGVEVDVVAAADLLEAWDRTADLAAIGTALWRETTAAFGPDAWTAAGEVFAVDFDPGDPVNTPAGLAPPSGDADPIVAAVAQAIRHLEAAGVDPALPLANHQWAQRGAVRVPLHGGGERDGVLNVLTPIGALPRSHIEPDPPIGETIADRSATTGLRTGGYQVAYGTSFVLLVTFSDDGPAALANLAYGQSGDPASVHHRDGTEAFAAKRLRSVRFHEADIATCPDLAGRVLRSPR